jgi:replicative DNA helicase
MAPAADRSSKIGEGNTGELNALEKSVLRTLCSTVNATGSELKYKILDSLSEDDFYFPVNKAVFTALNEMHRRGDYVVFTNLEEELQNRAVELPEDFFVEDLFRGELPELTEVGKWINRLKDRSRGGMDGSSTTLPPTPQPKVKAPTKFPPPAADPNATQIRATTEIRKIVSKSEKPATTPVVQSEPSTNPAAQKPARIESSPTPTTQPTLLSSEGDEWADYLEDIASKQGKRFETGFVGIDEGAGGLMTGIMVLADQDVDRRSAFLKQLTDQIAARSNVPCLFLSFGAPKSTLRIRTLSRLSGVPSVDIEKGRLKKDSRGWESMQQNGRKAAVWLKRVFVVEGRKDTGLSAVGDLSRQLAQSSKEVGAVVVIDEVEKLGSQDTASVFRKLRELSDSLELLVVAATSNTSLASGCDVDVTGEFRDDGARLILTVHRSGDAASTSIQFKHLPSVHRFTEQ